MPVKIPDDLIDVLSPSGVVYYIRLRRFIKVGQKKQISYRKLGVNRALATKNNFVLEKFGYLRFERGFGKNQPNTYEILK